MYYSGHHYGQGRKTKYDWLDLYSVHLSLKTLKHAISQESDNNINNNVNMFSLQLFRKEKGNQIIWNWGGVPSFM